MGVIVISPQDTIYAGLQQCNPGDILQLRGGTYGSQYDRIVQGWPVPSNLTVESYPGEIATLTFPGPDGAGIVDLYENIDFFTMKKVSLNLNLDTTPAYRCMRNLTPHALFEDCDFAGPLQTFVTSSGGMPVLGGSPLGMFRRCTFHDAWWNPNIRPPAGYGIYLTTDDTTVEYCEFFNLSWVMQLYNAATRTHRALIRQCYMHDCDSGPQDTGNDNVIQDCYFANIKGAAWVGTSAFNPRIINNIFYNCGNQGNNGSIFIDQNCSNVEVGGNKFYDCPGIQNFSSSSNIHDNTWFTGPPPNLPPLPPTGLITLPPEPAPPPEPPQPPQQPPDGTLPPTIMGGSGTALLLLGAALFLPKVRASDL